jgi:hypothetical protein
MTTMNVETIVLSLPVAMRWCGWVSKSVMMATGLTTTSAPTVVEWPVVAMVFCRLEKPVTMAMRSIMTSVETIVPYRSVVMV